MSRPSIGVFASVAIVLLLAIHASSQPPPTTQRTTSTLRPRTPPTGSGGTVRSRAPCSRPSTREELNAAMLSVYYHAAPRRPPPGPHRWRPISPVEAGRILRCDRSFGASARQRRAIVKLGARLLMLRVAHTPEANDRAEELLSAVEEIYPDAEAIISSVPSGGHDDVAMFEMSLQMKLDSAPDAPKRTCCACMDYCEVYPTDKVTGLASVAFRISTPRGYKSLATVLDPQAWDTCTSIYFPSTYYTGDTCPSGTSIPLESPTHPTEGTTWPAGILFEHFESNFKWGKAYFKNLLSIDALLDESKPMYSMDYGLCAALESQVLDEPEPTPGIGVDEDCGYAKAIDTSASPTKEESRVDALKCIKFSKRTRDDFGLDDLAQFGLEALADAVADVGVCCGAETDAECDCHEDCAQANPPPDPPDPKLCKNPRQCNPKPSDE